MTSRGFLRDNSHWLGAGALLTLLSSFGQTYFISLFSGHIRADFSLTDGEWGTLYAISTTASAVIMIWMGTLADRFRTRQLGVIVLVCLAITCIWMSFTTTIAGLLIAILFLRLFGQGMASHTAVVAMSRWFVATRGRALAVAALGFTFGEAVLPFSFVTMMGWVDWRWLWILAAAFTVTGIPVLMLLLRTERHPSQVAEDSHATGMKNRHWTRMQALAHPMFWFMAPAILGTSAFNTAFFFHQTHYAELMGWEHIKLVALFPIYTITAVGAMILSGWALDRWGTARLIPFYQLPMTFAFIAFAFGDSFFVLIAGFAMMALTSGANSTLPNAFWAEFYGTRQIGAIKATAAAVMVLGSAAGPFITGILIDRGVSLDVQYLWIAGFFVAVTLSIAVGIRLYREDVPSYLGRRR